MVKFLLGRILQIALAFGTVKVATSELDPDEMGGVYLVGAVVGFYAMFLLNPIGMYINRKINKWNSEGEVKQRLRIFWKYLGVVCLVSIFTNYTMGRLGYIASSFDITYFIAIVVLTLLFSTLNQVSIPALNLLGHRDQYVFLTNVTVLLSLIMAVLLVKKFGPTTENWLLGIISGQMVVGLIGLNVLYKKINISSKKISLESNEVSELTKFCWPVAIAVVFGWLQSQSYRFFMETELGLYHLGLFAAGYSVSAGIISAVESILLSYFQPKFYKSISSENSGTQISAWNDYARAIIPAIILLGFFLLASGEELTHIILGKSYWSAYEYMLWAVIAEVARVCSGVYGMFAHTKMKTNMLLLPNLLGAIVSVSLMLWLIPILHATGVGISLAVSSLSVFFITYIIIAKNGTIRTQYTEIVLSFFLGLLLIFFGVALRKYWPEINLYGRVAFNTVAMAMLIFIFKNKLIWYK